MTERPSWKLVAVDSLVLLALGLLAASSLRDAYGGGLWAVAVAGGLLFGLGAALVSTLLKWGPWLTALLVNVGYLLVGPALAVPDFAVARVFPSGAALRTLLTGLIDAWRDSLTLATPLGSSGSVLVVPFVIGLVGGVLAATLVWRSKWPGAAGLVLVGMFIASASFGSSSARLTVARGLALVIGIVVWTQWRRLRQVKVRWTRRLVLTAAVVAVAGGASTGFASLADPVQQREVLRDHVEPPFDPLDYPSPLSRFRAYLEPLKKAELFTVSGVEPKQRIRLATMDTFDGVVWNVSGGPSSPSSSGSFAPVRALPSVDGEQEVTITIGKYTGVWVPSPGNPLDVKSTDEDVAGRRLLNNAVTGTVAQEGGVSEGDTYTYRTVIPQIPSEAAIAKAGVAKGIVDPPAQDVPAELLKRVQKWVADSGTGGGGPLALLLRESFAKGYYSDGGEKEALSPAGHGSKRLNDLMAERDMVGNAEQYASAMGVASQRMGLPARVVIGFEVPDASGVVRGSNVDAWVEVALDGYGWVPLLPTPPKDRPLTKQTKDPEPEPQPQVLQPPTVPKEAKAAEQKIPQGAGSESSNRIFAVLAVLFGIAVTGVKIVLLLSPLWGILLVKLLRRRNRRGAEDPVARLSGGWKEVTDRARDLGTRLPHSDTRHESSVKLAERFPLADAQALAVVADRHTFGPVPPSDAAAADYWADVETALGRMRQSVPWWRRPLAWFSPASIPWHHVRATGERWSRTGWDLAKGKAMSTVGSVRLKAASMRSRGKDAD